jgi:hypothetical protein
MRFWKIKRQVRIWLGLTCPTCHADLRRVAKCWFDGCPLPHAVAAARRSDNAVSTTGEPNG